MVLAAVPVRPVAVAVILVAFAIWVAFLLRLGAGGRDERLPANIKPYLTDSELEGRKVVQVGVLGLFTAVGSAVVLAGYWLLLPSLQAHQGDRYLRESTQRGARLFATTEQGGLNCAGCHGGGKGGKIEKYVIGVAPEKGRKVTWESPSLDDVFYRFTREEVKQVLIYGRAGTPMPAWGLAGGGGQTDQEIEDILDYLKYIEIPAEEARSRAGADQQGKRLADGKTLFLKNCARCHTPKFNYTPADERVDLPQGVGAYGPNLTNEQSQFPDINTHIGFVKTGSTANKPYGQRGIGNGRMPGFARNPELPLLDDEQIREIAEYERSLRSLYGLDAPLVYTTTETVSS